MNFFKNLTNDQKGMFLIIIGLILLLNNFGVFRQALHYVILLTAIALIIYGMILGNYWSKIINFIKHYKNKR